MPVVSRLEVFHCNPTSRHNVLTLLVNVHDIHMTHPLYSMHRSQLQQVIYRQFVVRSTIIISLLQRVMLAHKMELP